jgi:hypothetical protein
MLAVMPFQFSMKWVLAAMAYAAIAAAAYTQRLGVYVDLLWAISVVAFAYALLVARYAQGERQAWATGFAILWACTFLAMQLAPHSFPTRRLLTTFGANSEPVQVYPLANPTQAYQGYTDPEAPTPIPSTPWNGNSRRLYSAPYAIPPTATPAVPFIPAAPTPGVIYVDAFAVRLRTANALTTMLAGLVGGMLGSLAYKNCRREQR